MPCLHWPRTSIQEFTWNSKSCPEGLPRKKKGRITRNATAITTNRGQGKIGPPGKISCCNSVLRSREDEFSRAWPPAASTRLQRDCCLTRANEQSVERGINQQITSVIVRRRSVENVRGISREINLPATLQKRLPARLRSFEVEQNPALRGPHERRRAGLSVFCGLS
jgi:hypothetical protein